MQKQLSLDELHKKYTRGELAKREFEERLFKRLFSHSRQFYFSSWNQEQNIDGLCRVYPRLSAAIDSYQDVGSSFEGYIKMKIYWYIKECRIREADLRIAEYACWETDALERAYASESFASEAEPEYFEGPRTPDLPGQNAFFKKKIVTPRQALILLLKAYFFVTDEFASRAAPQLGLKPEKLIGMLNQLRTLRFEREQELRRFRDNLHSQYYRCIVFERRYQAAPEGSAHRKIMQDRFQRAKKRYETMQKRYKGISVTATNKQVAEILGLPKGTVDSSLYLLKQKILATEAELQGHINHEYKITPPFGSPRAEDPGRRNR
ncbi:MAG: hypothetical protein LBG90_09735 [Spirochaetaceae bacterium]|nr:hypothetical protein [Spirochaetaceae bacterium]